MKIIKFNFAGGSEIAYQYDSLYRLTREERTGTEAYKKSYTYDPVGNRLKKEEIRGRKPEMGVANFDPDTLNINAFGNYVTGYLSPLPTATDKAWITAINNTSIYSTSRQRQ